MSHFDICMYLGGTSLEVSSQIICDKSMCFCDHQKGEIVGPKAISPSFDDNKTYIVMFLTILFNKISTYLFVAFWLYHKIRTFGWQEDVDPRA